VAAFVESATFIDAESTIDEQGRSRRLLGLLQPGNLRTLALRASFRQQAVAATLSGCSQLTSLELKLDRYVASTASLSSHLSAAICHCTSLQALNVRADALVSSGLLKGCTALSRLQDLRLATTAGEGLLAAPDTANLTRLASLTYLALAAGYSHVNRAPKALALRSMDAFSLLRCYRIVGEVQVRDSPLFSA
jgi:hypothetical protein